MVSRGNGGVTVAKTYAILAGAIALAGAAQKLDLQQALPFDGPALVQPSGLAYDGKRLLMISSVHDDAVYSVELTADKAVFKEAIRIKPPKDAEGKKMAWRGICALKGDLYLAGSEACRILKVESDGDAEWEGPGLLEAGSEKGLFAGENSGLEGVVPTGKKKFMVAAAREPRGLIDVDLSGPKPDISAWLVDKTKIALPTGRRKADFADLTEDHGQIWALCANSDAICQVKWNGSDYVEGEYYTFGHVSNDPKFKYGGLRMGLARGLAMDAHSIYIALDNKGVARQGDPTDKRPLLLVFKRPQGV